MYDGVTLILQKKIIRIHVCRYLLWYWHLRRLAGLDWNIRNTVIAGFRAIVLNLILIDRYIAICILPILLSSKPLTELFNSGVVSKLKCWIVLAANSTTKWAVCVYLWKLTKFFLTTSAGPEVLTCISFNNIIVISIIGTRNGWRRTGADRGWFRSSQGRCERSSPGRCGRSWSARCRGPGTWLIHSRIPCS